MNKKDSPYTAAITGGGFLFEETNILLPLLRATNSEELLHDEKVNNRLLHINAESSRKKAILEIKRRYESMPSSFWDDFLGMNDTDKIVAIFYVILRTYKICFDFHVASAYLTILRKVGMLDNSNHLNAISCSNFTYYLGKGQPWFLEACLLQPYEIENIKKTMI